MKRYDMHVHVWKGREEKDMEAMAKACELYGVDKIFISGLAGELPEPDAICTASIPNRMRLMKRKGFA